MLLDRLASYFVVHERAHIVLQRLLELVDDGHVSAFLTLLLQYVVDLEYLLVAVGQVVLGTHVAAK